MKFCPVVPEICCGQVHGPQKERRRKRRRIINNKKRSKNNKSPKQSLGDLTTIRSWPRRPFITLDIGYPSFFKILSFFDFSFASSYSILMPYLDHIWKFPISAFIYFYNREKEREEELCLVFYLYLFVFFYVIHDVNVCIYVEESY